MSLSRYYIENINIGENELTDTEARHLISVMRARVGNDIELFDGRGSVASARITALSKRTVTVDVADIRKEPPRTAGRIILAANPPKGQRWDWLLSKAVELGTDHIYPCIYERTVRQGNSKGFCERSAGIAISAAKQSKRLYLPQIDPPEHLNKCMDELKSCYPNAELIILSLKEDARAINSIAIDYNKQDVIVFVGPEGGFTAAEEDFIRQHGAKPIMLTSSVLRTETAAVTAAGLFCCMRDANG